ncbi:MAG: replicative DNA helicase, partial [Thermoguttaceae bacterium]|nr:replicative DNA helicase [Thermoguttaceae bacterium]
MAKTTKKPTATSPEGGGGIPDRPSPCNVEAERGVIGAILLDPALCDDIATLLRPDDFYLDKNRRIYRALLEMHAASQGIDLTLLVEQLRANNELEEVGGEAYLAELMTSVQVTAHAQYYAKIVQQNATRRQLIDTCGKIIN